MQLGLCKAIIAHEKKQNKNTFAKTLALSPVNLFQDECACWQKETTLPKSPATVLSSEYVTTQYMHPGLGIFVQSHFNRKATIEGLL